MKRGVLNFVYQKSPFDLKGDFFGKFLVASKKVSCLIVTKGKADILKNLLEDLAQQTLSRDQFEVVVVDNGEGHAVTDLTRQYARRLELIYMREQPSMRQLGYLRNLSVTQASGNILLFLDDDTRIFQKDFLERAVPFFANPELGVLIPAGHALFGLVKARYDFLDKHSFAARCLLIKKTLFQSLNGFYDFLHGGYEDIELGIRLSLANDEILKTDVLQYFHPPLYFYSMDKPFCIGQDILSLKAKYSRWVWWLVYLNSLRFLFRFFLPTGKNIQWGKISLGVLCAPFLRKRYVY